MNDYFAQKSNTLTEWESGGNTTAYQNSVVQTKPIFTHYFLGFCITLEGKGGKLDAEIENSSLKNQLLWRMSQLSSSPSPVQK